MREINLKLKEILGGNMKKVYFMLFLLCLMVISISAVEYAEMYIVDSTTDLIDTTWTTEIWRQVEGFQEGYLRLIGIPTQLTNLQKISPMSITMGMVSILFAIQSHSKDQ